MADSSSSSPAIYDAVTESNTSLLEISHQPEILAQNRALCRQSGIEDGPQSLRRLQHFVSQQIIKLLNKHNIMQKSGRPYVSSSPKGFLQGPDNWLADKGLYLSGWPRGLPRGSISIWPAHNTFALASMFINGTISLRPLTHALLNIQRIEESEEVADGKMYPTRTSSANVPSRNTAECDVRRRNHDALDSDQDAEGESDSDQGPSSSAVISVRKGESEPSASTIPDVFRSSRNTLTAIVPTPTTPTTPSKFFSADRWTKTEFPLSPPKLASTGTSNERFGAVFSDTHMLVSSGLSSSRKRKASDFQTEEMLYPAVPSGATVDWIPPTSAARESKRTRK